MKHIIKLGLVLGVLALVVGCTTFQLSGIQVVEDMPGMQPLGDFETTVDVWEFVGSPGGANLFNVTADVMDNEIRDAIRREIENRSGDAAINVQVKYEASFINILVSAVTFNILAPATATITGTVVSYN